MRTATKLVATLSLTAVLASAITSVAQASEDPVFVTTDGTSFSLEGTTFPVVGSNNYYLMYSSNKMVDAVLEKAAAADFNVMRTWAFFDDGGDAEAIFANDKGVYFQSWDDDTADIAFNDGANGLEMLDYVVWKAKEEGLRLVLPLTNNWSAFGGMDQYLAWAQEAGEDVDTHDDFYTNAQVKEWYMEWVSHLLNRTNPLTGLKYKDDPTIMTWELANEPRCIGDGGEIGGTWGTGKFPLDPACDSSVITTWADEMSTYIKGLDTNHLVAVGDEGFFDDATADEEDWTHNGNDGVDTVALASLANVDYMSYHLYPDHWGTDADWGADWIAEHNAAAATIGKPALLGEFGWQDKNTRNAVYKQWLDTQLETGGAGSLYWILSDVIDDDSLYADYDGFTVYCPSPVCTTVSNYGALRVDADAELAPVADNDSAKIAFGATSTLTVTANDIAYDATIDVATVDLDPSAAGRQSTVTVDGGTAVVTEDGSVTVTPDSGFSGTITVPYVVQDSAGRTSNAASVVITVEPSSEAWTTIEDFADGASGWACDSETATVSADAGVGVVANLSGAWTWCMLTLDEPLDLSSSAKLRYDFVGTDSGANASIAFKVGAADGDWCQIDGLVPNTWDEARVGEDGPTADFSRFSATCQEQLNAVYQIGLGIQAGTHQVDNIRVAEGYVAPPEGTIEAFAGDGSGWTCSDGATLATAAGKGVFTVPGGWSWCTYDLASTTDLTGKSGVSFDVADSSNLAGLNPSLVLKLGSGWTWCQINGSGAAIASGDTVTVSFDGLSEECSALLSEAHTVGLGLQTGSHTLDNVRFVAGSTGGGGTGDGLTVTVDDFAGDGSGWACDGGSTVSTSAGAGVFAIAGGWSWCLNDFDEAVDLTGKNTVTLDLVDSTGLAGLNPSLVLKLGSDWTWCQVDGAGSALGAGGKVTFDLAGLSAPCQELVGEAHTFGLGLQGGTHTIDNVTIAHVGDTSTTLVDAFGATSAWVCDSGASVTGGSGKGVVAVPGSWSWCTLDFASGEDLTGKTAIEFDLVDSSNLAGLNPYAVLKLGSGWSWCELPGSGATRAAGDVISFSLSGLSDSCKAALIDAHVVGFGFQGGTHTIDNVRFVGAADPGTQWLIKGATPTVSGSAKVGSVLTATAGTWTPAGVALAYQWLRDGVAISGATAATYTAVTADAGHRISVMVTGTKATFDAVSLTSAETAVVTAPSVPVKIVGATPTVSGSTKVGGTLTAKAGTWTPTGVKLAYQWLRDGKAIAGATRSTYITVRADIAHKISVKVTGSKSGSASVSKTSSSVGPIRYKDVSTTTKGYAAIMWLTAHKVVHPYADGTYVPSAGMSRRQVALYLYREAGSPAVKLPATSPFADVKKSDGSYTAIVWAKQKGLFTGSTLRPTAAVTRAELATALYAAAGKPPVKLPAKSPFKDVSRTSSRFEAIYWADKAGLVVDYSDGTFRSSEKVLRSSGATVLYTFAK